jgi:hypothetical protein
MATSLVPALQEGCPKRATERSGNPTPTMTTIRSAATCHPLPNGSSWPVHLIGDGSSLHSLRSHCQNLFGPLGPFGLPLALRLSYGGGFSVVPNPSSRLLRHPCHATFSAWMSQQRRNARREVFPHRPAITHRSGLRSAFGNRRCLFRGPIAADTIERRMVLQPGRDGLSRAVGKQGNGLAPLQITDPCPVPSPSPARPVVSAKNARL